MSWVVLKNLGRRTSKCVWYISSDFDGERGRRNHICGISQLIYNSACMGRNYAFRTQVFVIFQKKIVQGVVELVTDLGFLCAWVLLKNIRKEKIEVGF